MIQPNIANIAIEVAVSTSFIEEELTRFAFASRPWNINSHVNSNPLAPIQRGASLCRTESAKAQPANDHKTSILVEQNGTPAQNYKIVDL